MMSGKIKSCLFLAAVIFCLLPGFHVSADEVDMQEKYGYYLMDVPSGAKEMFYAEYKKKWDDSIYSERKLFLQRWELNETHDKMRKQRLESELKRQKQAEDLKEQAKAQEKQRKIREREVADQIKEMKKRQEKLRIKKKHEELFKKMDDLKNRQKSRNNGR